MGGGGEGGSLKETTLYQVLHFNFLNQVPEGDTGVVVWDAAIVLAKYLQTVQGQLQGRSVIGSSLDVASILRHT